MSPEKRDPDAHIVFRLTDEDGWPPAASERLWAYRLGADLYRIDNVPWFVVDLAVGDIVRAEPTDGDSTSDPVFIEVVERSDHVTVRLAVLRDGPIRGDLARAAEPFSALGVYVEGISAYAMLALDIAPTAPLGAVVATLRRGVEDGWWDYEEGRITPAWTSAVGA